MMQDVQAGVGQTVPEVVKRPVRKFEDLDVWKESMRLSVKVYRELGNCTDFGLRNQMQRSSVSVPSNIAEGFERASTKEFIRFLRIAKGSCGELRTQIYLAIRLGLIDKEVGRGMVEEARKIAGMLSRLIQVRLQKF